MTDAEFHATPALLVIMPMSMVLISIAIAAHIVGVILAWRLHRFLPEKLSYAIFVFAVFMLFRRVLTLAEMHEINVPPLLLSFLGCALAAMLLLNIYLLKNMASSVLKAEQAAESSKTHCWSLKKITRLQWRLLSG